jgi:alkylated DNA repair protein alkB family protein 6
MSNADAKQGLQAFRISGLPPEFYYIPNFITPEEEASILQKVCAMLCAKDNDLRNSLNLYPTMYPLITRPQIPAQRWTHLTHRRLQAHPSTLTKNNTLLASPLPAYLTNPVVQRFTELAIFKDTPHRQPNHVLINEYRPGEGIMPHEDGGAYAPVVATVSLGGSLCLEVTAKPSSADDDNDASEKRYALPTRILQEPRSLLITTGDAYRDLMHGIPGVEVDEDLSEHTVANWALLADAESVVAAGGRTVRETRVSLTYRDVLKVSSAASKVLGGMGRR